MCGYFVLFVLFVLFSRFRCASLRQFYPKHQSFLVYTLHRYDFGVYRLIRSNVLRTQNGVVVVVTNERCLNRIYVSVGGTMNIVSDTLALKPSCVIAFQSNRVIMTSARGDLRSPNHECFVNFAAFRRRIWLPSLLKLVFPSPQHTAHPKA